MEALWGWTWYLILVLFNGDWFLNYSLDQSIFIFILLLIDRLEVSIFPSSSSRWMWLFKCESFAPKEISWAVRVYPFLRQESSISALTLKPAWGKTEIIFLMSCIDYSYYFLFGNWSRFCKILLNISCSVGWIGLQDDESLENIYSNWLCSSKLLLLWDEVGEDSDMRSDKLHL